MACHSVQPSLGVTQQSGDTCLVCHKRAGLQLRLSQPDSFPSHAFTSHGEVVLC